MSKVRFLWLLRFLAVLTVSRTRLPFTIFFVVVKDADQNSRYVKGLMENLSALLDKYILSGSPKTVSRSSCVF